MTRARLTLITMAAIVSAACNPSMQSQANPTSDGSASCSAVEVVPVQAGDHLIGDQAPPVPYSSTPPTSGWHVSGTFEITIQPPNDPLSEPRQVSILEAGGVVVTYNGLPPAGVEQLTTHIRENYPGRVALTPYDQLPEGEMAMTGFGLMQRCTALDLEVVDNFARSYADEQPAVPGTVD